MTNIIFISVLSIISGMMLLGYLKYIKGYHKIENVKKHTYAIPILLVFTTMGVLILVPETDIIPEQFLSLASAILTLIVAFTVAIMQEMYAEINKFENAKEKKEIEKQLNQKLESLNLKLDSLIENEEEKIKKISQVQTNDFEKNIKIIDKSFNKFNDNLITISQNLEKYYSIEEYKQQQKISESLTTISTVLIEINHHLDILESRNKNTQNPIKNDDCSGA